MLANPSAGWGQDPANDAARNDADPVTYQDVLANPDDVTINYRYARRMIDAGHLDRASAALERILITNPEADRIRLLYGVVLYRLGNDGEALQELKAVDREALPAEDQRTLDDTLSRIQRARQRFRGSVGLTAGLHLDTNRNAFPASGEFQADLPGAGPTRFDARGSENTDVGHLVLLDGRARIRTPWQRLPGVTLEAAGLRDNQMEEDALDSWTGLIGASTTYRGDTYDVSPSLTYRHSLLGGEPYLRKGAGRLRVSRAFGTGIGLTGFVEGGLVYEDYSGVERAPFADEQDGPIYEGRLGVRLTPTNRLELGFAYRFRHKDAAEDFESFDAHRIDGNALYVLVQGISLSAEAAYTRRKFDAVDTFVAQNDVQKDNEYFARAGITAGIGSLLEMTGVEDTGQILENLQVTFAGQYRHVDSNIPNFAYENIRAETMITKRIPF